MSLRATVCANAAASATSRGSASSPGADGFDRLVRCPADERRDRVLLAGAVAVEGPQGDTGGVGDVLDGHRVVAAIGEQGLGGPGDVQLGRRAPTLPRRSGLASATWVLTSTATVTSVRMS